MLAGVRAREMEVSVWSDHDENYRQVSPKRLFPEGNRITDALIRVTDFLLQKWTSYIKLSVK